MISRDDIPVLMGGALPFTNMQNLLSENHDDGTYRYEDITEDGQLLVVNTAEQSCFVPDVQELDDYLETLRRKKGAEEPGGSPGTTR